MSESLFFALSLALILPLGMTYYIPIRRFLRHPLPIVILMNLGIYALLFFIVPPLAEVSNGHLSLIMLPLLALFFAFCYLNTSIDVIRSAVIFLWAGGLISFASGFTNAICLATGLDPSSLNAQLIRLAISFIIFIFTFLYTFKWNEYFVTDPNVPVQLWLSFLALPVIFFYLNITLIAYTPDMIGSPKELYAYIFILAGSFVMFALLTNVFYSNAVLYIERAKLSEEKSLLEIQKAQYTNLTRDVNRTNKLHHDLKHTINTLRSLAAEDGADHILAYLDNMSILTADVPSMNYTGNAPINSVLNHYAYRANTQDVPLKLQVDIPDKIPMEDHEICSLIGNLMENAIDASMSIPTEKRSFTLSLVMKDNNLIIVSTNNFDGKIKKSGKDFLSTKHSGHGIGIRSIRETVEHYGGTIRVHHEKNQFFVDIMLSFPK